MKMMTLLIVLALLTACGQAKLEESADMTDETEVSYVEEEEVLEEIPDFELPMGTVVGGPVDLLYDHNGMERQYRLYIPTSYHADMPLIMALHRWGSFVENYEQYTGLSELAEVEGYVVCYPIAGNGAPEWEGWGGNPRGWNANFSRANEPLDDVAYLTDLALQLQEEYQLNESIYVVGHELGGYMAYSLALASPEVFDAVGVVGGRMSGPDWASRNEAKPMPLIHIHGSACKYYDLGDGLYDDARDEDWCGAPVADEIVAFWADVNNAKVSAAEMIDESVQMTTYKTDDGEVLVEFYLIQGADSRLKKKDPMTIEEANLKLLSFFSQF